jgi:hypothetical protein
MVRKPHADRNSHWGGRNAMSQHGFMIVSALAAILLLGRKLLLVLFAILMAVFFLGLYDIVEFMHRV